MLPEIFRLVLASGALIAAMVLAIPIVVIVTYHRRKMEELRMRHQVSIAEETRAAIEGIRKDVSALRDTTTEYDVSFDTALRRIESQVGHLEQRMQRVERQQESVTVGSGQEDLRASI